MKINMGCGFNKIPGFINVDKFMECSPDFQMDIEKFPWPMDTNMVEEVVFNHCLEHLGQDTDVFMGMIQELYRVSKDNAKICINVPHPRHDNFISDPTHVRIINYGVLSLLSKKLNLYWQEIHASNSPLALYWDVDFEVVEQVYVLDPYYKNLLESNALTNEDIERFMQERNNVVSEIQFVLRVRK